jgi:DNA-directed RNA polymerase specialized sigma subunit
MFDKLSFEELATFYTALAELEKHYGKAAVQAAAADMANTLDTKNQLEFEFEEVEKEKEKTPTKRVVTFRRSPGENEKQIREWCERKFGLIVTPEEAVLAMYYRDGMTQAKIGEMIGVNQRAVGYFINNIPEKRKRKIMSEWPGADNE